MVEEWQFSLLATSDADTLLCSIPMALSLSLVVSRGILYTAMTVLERKLFPVSKRQELKLVKCKQNNEFPPPR